MFIRTYFNQEPNYEALPNRSLENIECSFDVGFLYAVFKAKEKTCHCQSQQPLIS